MAGYMLCKLRVTERWELRLGTGNGLPDARSWRRCLRGEVSIAVDRGVGSMGRGDLPLPMRATPTDIL